MWDPNEKFQEGINGLNMNNEARFQIEGSKSYSCKWKIQRSLRASARATPVKFETRLHTLMGLIREEYSMYIRLKLWTCEKKGEM